jgi:nucleotide-binding universal stress UspA family protein
MRGIIVGFDGSPPAQRALEWAHEQARRRGGPLTAVHVYRSPSHHAPGQAPYPTLGGGDAPVERWLAVWRAVREWALAHRHEFALLFGTPVPGYTAPQETGPAAGRMPLTLVAIAAEARAAGALAEVPGPKCDPALLDDAVQEIAAAVGGPPEDAAGLVLAWNRLVGMIAFELHGHFHRVITDYEAFFEHAARVEATRIGLD